MKSFDWANASTVEEAVTLLKPADAKADADQMARPIAGGQDLLTTMKAYIMTPPRVVNLKTIKGLDYIKDDGKGGLKIGALATLTALENHPLITKNFPGLSEAAHSIATPQIRNLGTLGGNLCQRPRCWYFRLDNYKCLKKGGTECFASTGENKYNAIIAGGPSFIVHPSDLAPMLIALNASVTIAGPDGSRTLPLEKFFILPDVDVRKENILKDGELLTEIQIPATTAKSTYLKFKERDSLDFAIVSAAVALTFNDDKTIKTANLLLGGVAPIPWRAKDAETFLTGKTLSKETITQAATLALKDADPLAKNAYKVPLAQTIVRRALSSTIT